MAFSNQSIVAPVKGKPHIVLRAGFWRVSPMPKPYHRYNMLWNLAHLRARLLNVKRPFAGNNWNLVAVDEMTEYQAKTKGE
ncbi:hypothetical protein Shy_CDS0038 [Escherichia phage Shy]|nr:hypothetical protein Shy_CDS0038 [Escherichia phage Shy]